MAEIIYNKLVRDGIVDIIEAEGKIAVHHRIEDDEEFIKALQDKMQEELAELSATDKPVEELVDLFEVMRAMCEAYGTSYEVVEKIRQKKAVERGSFNERVFLEKVKM